MAPTRPSAADSVRRDKIREELAWFITGLAVIAGLLAYDFRALWGIVATALVILVVHIGLRPLIRDSVIENFAGLALLLVGPFLLAGLITWLLVNLYWTPQDSLTARTASLPLADGAALIAVHPRTMPINADPRELRLEVTWPTATPGPTTTPGPTATPGATPSPTPLVIAVDLPPGVIFAGSLGETSRAIPLTTRQANRTSARVLLTNDGSFFGWRDEKQLRLSAAGVTTQATESTIIVEGRWAFRVRQFVLNTINAATPLTFLLTLLVPVGAVWLQRVLEQSVAAIRQQRERAFAREQQQFREAFLAGRLVEARQAQEAMTNRRYDRLNEDEAAMANSLLHYALLDYELPQPGQNAADQTTADQAAGQTDPPRLDEKLIPFGRRWPEGLAMAELLATRAVNNQTKLRGWARQPELLKLIISLRRDVRFELEYLDVADKHLQGRLSAAAAAQPGRFSPQQRAWPSAAAVALPNPQPFADRPAGDPDEALFLLGGGFWEGHDLYQELSQFEWSRVVYGAEGVGRAALRLMLRHSRWALVLDCPPSAVAGNLTGDVAGALAGRLFEFICEHPTYLFNAGRSERLLLGKLFAAYLGPDLIQAALDRRQAMVEQIHDITDNELEDSARMYLELLKTAVAAADRGRRPGRPRAPEPAVAEIAQIATALGFQHVVLLYKWTGPDAQPLTALMRGDAAGWHDGRLRHLAFLAPTHVTENLKKELGPRSCQELTWNETQMRAMIDHRYQRYQKKGLPAAYFESDEGFEALLAASKKGEFYNPRRFMKLWAAVLPTLGPERVGTVSMDHVGAAIDKVGNEQE